MCLNVFRYYNPSNAVFKCYDCPYITIFSSKKVYRDRKASEGDFRYDHVYTSVDVYGALVHSVCKLQLFQCEVLLYTTECTLNSLFKCCGSPNTVV